MIRRLVPLPGAEPLYDSRQEARPSAASRPVTPMAERATTPSSPALLTPGSTSPQQQITPSPVSPIHRLTPLPRAYEETLHREQAAAAALARAAEARQAAEQRLAQQITPKRRVSASAPPEVEPIAPAAQVELASGHEAEAVAPVTAGQLQVEPPAEDQKVCDQEPGASPDQQAPLLPAAPPSPQSTSSTSATSSSATSLSAVALVAAAQAALEKAVASAEARAAESSARCLALEALVFDLQSQLSRRSASADAAGRRLGGQVAELSSQVVVLKEQLRIYEQREREAAQLLVQSKRADASAVALSHGNGSSPGALSPLLLGILQRHIRSTDLVDELLQLPPTHQHKYSEDFKRIFAQRALDDESLPRDHAFEVEREQLREIWGDSPARLVATPPTEPLTEHLSELDPKLAKLWRDTSLTFEHRPSHFGSHIAAPTSELPRPLARLPPKKPEQSTPEVPSQPPPLLEPEKRPQAMPVISSQPRTIVPPDRIRRSSPRQPLSRASTPTSSAANSPFTFGSGPPTPSIEIESAQPSPAPPSPVSQAASVEPPSPSLVPAPAPVAAVSPSRSSVPQVAAHHFTSSSLAPGVAPTTSTSSPVVVARAATSPATTKATRGGAKVLSAALKKVKKEHAKVRSPSSPKALATAYASASAAIFESAAAASFTPPPPPQRNLNYPPPPPQYHPSQFPPSPFPYGTPWHPDMARTRFGPPPPPPQFFHHAPMPMQMPLLPMMPMQMPMPPPHMQFGFPPPIQQHGRWSPRRGFIAHFWEPAAFEHES